jgi:hypothetical protein
MTYQTQGGYLTPTDKIKPNPGPTIVDDIRARSFSRPAIKNDSGVMIRSRLHSSVHALGDEIQDSCQRRD